MAFSLQVAICACTEGQLRGHGEMNDNEQFARELDADVGENEGDNANNYPRSHVDVVDGVAHKRR